MDYPLSTRRQRSQGSTPQSPRRIRGGREEILLHRQALFDPKVTRAAKTYETFTPEAVESVPCQRRVGSGSVR